MKHLRSGVAAVLSAALALLGSFGPVQAAEDAPGKEILHPVAVAIFGGLISATLLDTILTPVLFLRFGRKPLARLQAAAQTSQPKEVHSPAPPVEAF